MTDNPDLIGLKEAAAILGVHVNTVRNWGARGRLEEIRVGRRGDRRYRRREVEQLRAKLDGDRSGPDALRHQLPAVAPRVAEFSEAMSKMATPPTILLAAQQFAEFSEAMSKMATPPMILLASKRLAEFNEAISKMATPPTILLAAQQFAEFSEAMNKMATPPTILLASQRLAEFNEAISRMVLPPSSELLARVASVSNSLIAHQLSIGASVERISRAVPLTLGDEVIVAAARAGRVLSQLDRLVVGLGPGTIGVQRAASLVESFDVFSATIAERLQRGREEGVDEVVIGELAAGTTVLGGGVEPLRSLAGVAPDAPWAGDGLVVNVFTAILSEVDKRGPRLIKLSAEEATDAIATTLPVRIARAAMRLLRARTSCTRSAEFNGQEPIFKATIDTEDAAVGLPFTIATSADAFADCVNSLYKLVYESSGDLKRIPDAFKLPDSILFDLKCLRTHFFHDVHHGEPAKQRKKLLDIGHAFKKLGGSFRAESSTDWQRMQLRLLSQLADLLDEVDAMLAGARPPRPDAP